MRVALLLVPLMMAAVFGSAAAADSPSCIDPQRGYNARALNQHDILVQNSIGRRRAPVRLTTSCIHLEPAVGFGLTSPFGCIGQGDRVVASILGGHAERCIVTRVQAYVPQEGDFVR